MRLFSFIRSALYERKTQSIDVDSVDLVSVHRANIQKKRLLRSAFKSFYCDMADNCDRFLSSSGVEIELGSGVGFFKKIRPEVITSDIRAIPAIDRVLDAQHMDLPDNSVRCIYAINVFHHLPNPEGFFSELNRVLNSGGGCVLIEPHNGTASRLLHRHLHKDERFDPTALTWQTTNIRGPLSGANQALAHIVFKRDKQLFDEKYGQMLEVVSTTYCINSLRYFFSGGLNFRQLLPSFFEPLLRVLEILGRPFAKHWTFHQIIVIRKR